MVKVTSVFSLCHKDDELIRKFSNHRSASGSCLMYASDGAIKLANPLPLVTLSFQHSHSICSFTSLTYTVDSDRVHGRGQKQNSLPALSGPDSSNSSIAVSLSEHGVSLWCQFLPFPQRLRVGPLRLQIAVLMWCNWFPVTHCSNFLILV